MRRRRNVVWPTRYASCRIRAGYYISLLGKKNTLFVLNRSYRVLIKGIPLAIYALIIILLGSFTVFGNKRSVTLLRETASPLGDLCKQLQLQLRCVTMHNICTIYMELLTHAESP